MFPDLLKGKASFLCGGAGNPERWGRNPAPHPVAAQGLVRVFPDGVHVAATGTRTGWNLLQRHLPATGFARAGS